MSQLWFTADLHLGHGNIIQYCHRPGLSAEESLRAKEDSCGGWRVSKETVVRHDAALIDAINGRVGEDDTLWILGDYSHCPFEEARSYRERIRCRTVNLVRGNHDLLSYDALFHRVIDQGMIKHGGSKIWLNHYPMRSWDKAFHGAWHLHGHVHGRLRDEDAANPHHLAMDVGVDACGYRPLSFADVADYMRLREEAFWKWKAEMVERKG